MRFLLRMAFWLSLVVLLLPTGRSNTGSDAAELSAAEAVSAAGAAVADFRQFCDRRPEACTVGTQAAVAFANKARAGAKMLYDFLNEKLAPSETGSIGAVVDGQPPRHNVKSQDVKSQDTLTPSDLKPEWRGPQPRREAQAHRPAA